MTGWTYAWIAWGLMFLAIELPAAMNKSPGDTLTEHVRRWFALRDKPRQWRWRRFALLAFMVGLTTHFLLGWP